MNIDNIEESRPWGNFLVIKDEKDFKVKRITIKAGHAPSYQSHNFRNEHWIILNGNGTLTLDDIDFDVKAGDYLYIPKNNKHRLSASSEIIFIEIQTGSYFGEDDIIRFDDKYGRL